MFFFYGKTGMATWTNQLIKVIYRHGWHERRGSRPCMFINSTTIIFEWLFITAFCFLTAYASMPLVNSWSPGKTTIPYGQASSIKHTSRQSRRLQVFAPSPTCSIKSKNPNMRLFLTCCCHLSPLEKRSCLILPCIRYSKQPMGPMLMCHELGRNYTRLYPMLTVLTTEALASKRMSPMSERLLKNSPPPI